ncbi:zinc ABC transporter substrate-binding protein [Microbacterium sp. BK668]|uniref:metal ABC transporter solute-binding protein, Zn/Mn family n=1 Tax=Microbacterium sp. BK668 TaxID=2512118 RepID=UPI00105F2B8B|nr:zinc ABC transporter substrate-binding protein [Microbacterium sp. BK668]TDN91108.1 zinc/manganese transport system substrate-binding protein [Microbacterium sp. BK668]
MPRRSTTLAALAAASVLVLAGCATTGTSAGDDGRVQVVASTNVYGQIAQAVGADAVDVTAIIDSAAQDPHSYEASARDQLTVSRADLVIENGGGYDAFIDGLLEATGIDAPVLTAAEYSHDWPGNGGHHDEDATGEPADASATGEPTDDHGGEEHPDEDGAHAGDDHGHDHVEGFNEHVWYDLDAMSHLAAAIAEELSALRPGDAAAFEANAADFAASIEELEAELAALDAAHGGTPIFVTEPVPLYLTGAAGLENVAPEAFSEAVEEGQDVPPATLLEGLGLIRSGDVRAVIVNSQTGGAETDAVIDEADQAGIPVLEFSEVVPDSLTYVEWMQRNIDALGKAVGA